MSRAGGALSKADHEQITELAEKRGWKANRIANHIGKNSSTVQWFMYRTGLQVPKYRANNFALRHGRVVKRFTPEEDKLITMLRGEGWGPTKIAQECTARFGHPRSMHTVSCRLIMTAALEIAT